MTAIKLDARSPQPSVTGNVKTTRLRVIEGGQAATVDNTVRALRRRRHQYEVSIIGLAPGRASQIVSSNVAQGSQLGTVTHSVSATRRTRQQKRVIANSTRELSQYSPTEKHDQRVANVSRVAAADIKSAQYRSLRGASLSARQSATIATQAVPVAPSLSKNKVQRATTGTSNAKKGVYVSAILLAGIGVLLALFNWLVPISHSQTHIVQIAEKTTITQLATKLADSPTEISALEAQITRINNLNTNAIEAGAYLTLPMR